MRKKSYRLERGSIQDQFQQSRNKIQLFGGGFANGKTTAMVIKGLNIASKYPGSNGLIARATFPRLRDTIMKVWFEWMPRDWQDSFNKTDSILTMKNGTVVNFRHLSQTGQGIGGDTTSNLLSATYDWIIIDQLEDPEITEKDFLDLLGRLRGDTEYNGDDSTMPQAGPRWLLCSCNPTSNWVYRKIVRPIHRWQNGIHDDELLVHPASGVPIVDVIEGSTYTNAVNLNKYGDDYISTLEASYRGQMKKRFLDGEWGTFEGLVYPDYDEKIHVLSHKRMLEYLNEMRFNDIVPTIREGYDHGLAVQSCYMLSFTDPRGNVFVLDGFYDKEKPIDTSAREIKAIREIYKLSPSEDILADPSCFRRTTGTTTIVGKTVAGLFDDCGISMARGNRDIPSGIAKVQGYLAVYRHRRHPISNSPGSPALFFSDKLTWLLNEITDYRWRKDTGGDVVDKPIDRRDHAMDTLKYMFTHAPEPAKLVIPKYKIPPAYMKWGEIKHNKDPREHRYHG